MDTKNLDVKELFTRALHRWSYDEPSSKLPPSDTLSLLALIETLDKRMLEQLWQDARAEHDLYLSYSDDPLGYIAKKSDSWNKAREDLRISVSILFGASFCSSIITILDYANTINTEEAEPLDVEAIYERLLSTDGDTQ